MPNAADIILPHENYLMLGGPGTGKTTLLRTLPGKKFIYCFDPNILPAIKGDASIDYEIFSPDIQDIDISIKAFKKSATSDRSSRRKGDVEPLSYIQFEDHLLASVENGFFDPYSVISLDSFTTLSDSIMDRIMYQDNRLGKNPEQSDYAVLTNTIQSVFRSLAGLDKIIYCTGHIQLKRNDITGQAKEELMMPGRVRVRLPMLFTHIFRCWCDSTEKEILYTIQTRPNKEIEHIRTSLQNLDFEEDVTIPAQAFAKGDLTPYGLGKLLKKASLS